MEERIEISILLDFYGVLLTNKQSDIMNMYYNEDLSLGEISELNNTSRQAIHDSIKRCCKLLLEYEEKLELKRKNDIMVQTKDSLIKKLDYIVNKIEDNDVGKLVYEIKKEVTENL